MMYRLAFFDLIVVYLVVLHMLVDIVFVGDFSLLWHDFCIGVALRHYK
jgi:hypothetical protein